MILAAADAINWWTDVAVPFGSALIGGLLAVIGALIGAKKAAKEQANYARLIDRERRQAEALLAIDEPLKQLEFRADANEKQWIVSPESMSSNWKETLTPHLHDIDAVWADIAARLRDPATRDAVGAFVASDFASQTHAAQEHRNSEQDQASIDAARSFNKFILEETRRLRKSLNAAL
jgi:hypothetical protein